MSEKVTSEYCVNELIKHTHNLLRAKSEIQPERWQEFLRDIDMANQDANEWLAFGKWSKENLSPDMFKTLVELYEEFWLSKFNQDPPTGVTDAKSFFTWFSGGVVKLFNEVIEIRNL